MPAKYTVEGTENVNVNATWTPEMREGDFIDYNLDIDIFSMGYQSPDDRVQNITNMLNLFAQFQDGLMQQGGQIDFERLLELFSELTNEPRLREFIKFGEQDLAQAGLNKVGPQGTPSMATESVINTSEQRPPPTAGPGGPGPGAESPGGLPELQPQQGAPLPM